MSVAASSAFSHTTTGSRTRSLADEYSALYLQQQRLQNAGPTGASVPTGGAASSVAAGASPLVLHGRRASSRAASSASEGIPKRPDAAPSASGVGAAKSVVSVLTSTSITGGAASATTSVMQQKLNGISTQLERERQQRAQAEAELKRTVAELEAMERLLKLRK